MSKYAVPVFILLCLSIISGPFFKIIGGVVAETNCPSPHTKEGTGE